ncbi:hypothetical protein Tco_0445394 [Tanacetum coccineum]
MAFATRYTDDTLQILGLHEDQCISSFIYGLRTRNLVEFLSTDFSSTYKGLMEKTYMWIEAREVATNGTPNDQRESFEKSKKTSWDSNRGQRSRIGKEITFPSVTRNHNSSALMIIKAMIFGRQVNRVYMDIGSSSEVIYEHCFLKLKPSIRASKVDLKVPLVGFSGEHYWPIGEVPLEITIGDAPFSRTDTLNFAIVRSNSLHNLLPGRTAMQKMGIVVSTIHGAIKFHTTQGVGTVFSTYESKKVREGLKNIKEASPINIQGILSCMNVEERIIVNDKHPEQTVIIGKQLPENFKEKLQNLLKGKPFNTEHKLNEYCHIKPIKQKRRGLGPDRSTSACKEVEELMKAGILQRVKNQIATYQRRVDKVFSDQIRRNLEAYVDDMVIKSISEEDMLQDIQETFMKLNPKKCSFGVEEGLFLGHLITKQGIRANPSKVKAVTDLDQPKTLKDTEPQWRLADTQKLYKQKNHTMDTGGQRSPPKMKKFMEILPTLTAPIKGEALTMYLTDLTKSFAKRDEG